MDAKFLSRPVFSSLLMTARRMLLAAGLCCVAFAASGDSSIAWAQIRPMQRESSVVEKLLHQIHEKSAVATSLAEYNDIIKLCQQAQRLQLTQTSSAYVQQLMSWAHNRRGETYTEKALTLMQEGKSSEARKLDSQALAEYEAAVKADPSRWKAVHNRGVSYAALGKSQAAIADFTRVIKLNPEHANAWFNRAEVHYDRREFEQAAADYSEAIRLKPNDVAAYTGRGHAYFQMARYREAFADYDQTTQLSENDPHALTNRADAAARLGQWERAANDYRQAVELDPNLGRAHQGAAWLMATCPDSTFRNHQLALQAAKKAIELEGNDDAKFLDTLAAAYANAGQFEEAKALVARAVELAPVTEVEPLKVRMTMYEQGEPYRQGRVNAAKPANRKASNKPTGKF